MRSLQWLPYMLSDLTVNDEDDLVRLVLDMRELQAHTRRCLPLLVDCDIHYRLLKLMYSPRYVHLNVRERLREHPLLYGVCPVCHLRLSEGQVLHNQNL